MTLTKGVKMFLGLGEYSDPSNIVRNDGHFLNSLRAKFGTEKVNAKIEELKKTY